MINLSELQSYEIILCENNNTIIYVDDLKTELAMSPSGSDGKYFTTTSDVLKFDAKEMIRDYIRSYEESGDGYEDMTERCMEDISTEDIEQIQKILDKIAHSTESFITYYKGSEINIYK